MLKRLGDQVQAGEPLAELYVNEPSPEEAKAAVLKAVTVSRKKPEQNGKLVLATIHPEDV